MTKRRDKLNITTIEKDPKEFENLTRNQVFFRAYQLRDQILPQFSAIMDPKRKSPFSPNRTSNSRSKYLSSKTFAASQIKTPLKSFANTSITSSIPPKENQKKMAAAAEVLQKGIMRLEETLKTVQKKSRSKNWSHTETDIKCESPSRLMGCQNLAGSILSRANEYTGMTSEKGKTRRGMLYLRPAYGPS